MMLQQLSDDELRALERLAEERCRESWLVTAAAAYLVFCGPLIVFLPLLRAAERSRTYEVVLWVAAASLAGVAALYWRAFTQRKRAWAEAREELQRRQD
jgi:hypothetical protein